MGLLMVAGIFGLMGYMGYYAKNELTAVVGDNTIQPTNTTNEDKQLIARHFKLICKRGNAKLDANGNPVDKNGHKQCTAYLRYQGFQKFAVDYFEKIYLEKYNSKYEEKIANIKDKHRLLGEEVYYEHNEFETKIFRHWDLGDTHTKCEKMMKNWLWNRIVTHYDIVRDGASNVEIWTIKAPQSVLRQIDTIYEEVSFLEVYSDAI